MSNFFINAGKHFKLVCIHKWYVFKNCKKAGLFWTGVKHDMSKFSPTEFLESVKYFNGSKSPIDVCKQKHGWSKAWMHHKGRNPHHYEYWQDNFDKGGESVRMPYKYALELVCDYLGAGKAYMKEGFSYKSEYEWWLNKKKNGLAMHPHTYNFVENMLYTMYIEESNDCLRPIRSNFIYRNSGDSK